MPGNLEGIIHSAGALRGPCMTQAGQWCPADRPLGRISERDGLMLDLFVRGREGPQVIDRKAKSRSLFCIFSYGLVCLKKKKIKKECVWKVGWLPSRGSCR